MMKVTAPISSVHEVEILAQQGATEFYCGVMPQDWIEKHTAAIWINKRGIKGNITSFKALKSVVDRSHALSIPVFLTLNMHCYTQAQYPMLLDVIQKAVYDAEIDALIVADIGLLLTIKQIISDINLIMSTTGCSYNSQTVRFYRDLGVSRVILPRYLNLQEIENISKEIDDMEYEVFVLNDRCTFSDGYCMTAHEVGDLPLFCRANWGYVFSDARGNAISYKEISLLREHLMDYNEWRSPYSIAKSVALPRDKIRNTGCGLCAIPDFHRMNIFALKISGRTYPTHLKVKSVKIVSEMVQSVEQKVDPANLRKKAKGYQEFEELCDLSYMCYYR